MNKTCIFALGILKRRRSDTHAAIDGALTLSAVGIECSSVQPFMGNP